MRPHLRIAESTLEPGRFGRCPRLRRVVALRLRPFTLEGLRRVVALRLRPFTLEGLRRVVALRLRPFTLEGPRECA